MRPARIQEAAERAAAHWADKVTALATHLSDDERERMAEAIRSLARPIQPSDLRGLVPGLTGGLGAEEWVRRIRDHDCCPDACEGCCYDCGCSECDYHSSLDPVGVGTDG